MSEPTREDYEQAYKILVLVSNSGVSVNKVAKVFRDYRQQIVKDHLDKNLL